MNTKGKVLVVDDNPTNLIIAEKALREAGYLFQTVSSGSEAIKKVSEENFDIILMDVNMPKMSGIEATRQIIENLGVNAPVIFGLSANVLQTEENECREAGMKGFISKPLQASTIKRVFENKISANATKTFSDLERLREIFSEDIDVLNVIILKFSKTYRNLIDDIENAIQNRDDKAAREKLHLLNGTIRNFLANGVIDKISKLEELVTLSHFDEAKNLLSNVRIEVERLSQELNEFSKELAS